mmetsp:Transcript_9226/g.12221  ORF Transcript_9226/g.12221 Transcript_9226/m.12221 type:complete len:289 (+) Transcript_9226:341-1207(+)|eukprot:CAMPEP_0117753146 /NCGR_PEP_ID=MMETSP0947-20121206/12047_1 /TAXON_ID=44440 /ORGANISM="Chattonella subsalsa, Strain CCMP2191" /LENGTH=288 /DNA_ID=CAMNT_0005571963 /DNA_START=550 /DNA_END=1416 /DNA_ORIENTATION=+
MGGGASIESKYTSEQLEWLRTPNKQSPQTIDAGNGELKPAQGEIDEVLSELCSKPSILSNIISVQEGTSLTKMGTADYLAQKGYLESLIYAKKTNTNLEMTPKAMDFGAGEGHLAVVEWLHQNRSEGCTVEAMNTAAKNGHLEIVQWLHKNRQEGCNKDALTFACRHGHLEVAEFLHANRSEGCAAFTLKTAAMNGHLHVVEWLHKNKDHPNFKGMKTKRGSFVASDNGHDAVANFLIAQEKAIQSATALTSLVDMDGETQKMILTSEDAPTPVAKSSPPKHFPESST